MKRQLALKGICSVDEWEVLKEKIHYDFIKDNNFTELKEAEMMANRIQLLNTVDPYIGTYFSRQWIKKHILHLNEEDIAEMDAEIAAEEANMPSQSDLVQAAADELQQNAQQQQQQTPKQ
jgi:hypothetical protein